MRLDPGAVDERVGGGAGLASDLGRVEAEAGESCTSTSPSTTVVRTSVPRAA